MSSVSEKLGGWNNSKRQEPITWVENVKDKLFFEPATPVTKDLALNLRSEIWYDAINRKYISADAAEAIVMIDKILEYYYSTDLEEHALDFKIGEL